MLKRVKEKTAKIKAELRSVESNISRETNELYKIEALKKLTPKKPAKALPVSKPVAAKKEAARVK